MKSKEELNLDQNTEEEIIVAVRKQSSHMTSFSDSTLILEKKDVSSSEDTSVNNKDELPPISLPIFLVPTSSINEIEQEGQEEYLNIKNFQLEIKNCNSSYSTFISNLKRKWAIDSIHKKIKARMFKFLKNTLRRDLKVEIKFPQHLIVNVAIGFNKKLFEMSLREILELFNIESIFMKNHIKTEIDDFFNKSFVDLYYMFMHNPKFKEYLNELKCKYGGLYAERFKILSLNFIEYYKYTAPNQKGSRL